MHTGTHPVFRSLFLKGAIFWICCRNLFLDSVQGTYVGGRTGSSGGILHVNLSRLSQLTGLRLLDSLPIRSLGPILGLPLLEDVAISVQDSGNDSSSLEW